MKNKKIVVAITTLLLILSLLFGVFGLGGSLAEATRGAIVGFAIVINLCAITNSHGLCERLRGLKRKITGSGQGVS
jgi:hypothetical protein